MTDFLRKIAFFSEKVLDFSHRRIITTDPMPECKQLAEIIKKLEKGR